MKLSWIVFGVFYLQYLDSVKAEPVETSTSLATAIQEAYPTFIKDSTIAVKHAEAAIEASTATNVPAERLLAIAAIESNFHAKAISRIECNNDSCKRVAGRWRGNRKKPKNVRGAYFCGVHQTGGNITWDHCWKIIENIDESYIAAAIHLEGWYNDPFCKRIKNQRKRWTCAMYGYGGGYRLIRLSRDRSLKSSPALYYPQKIRNAEALILRKLPKDIIFS